MSIKIIWIWHTAVVIAKNDQKLCFLVIISALNENFWVLRISPSHHTHFEDVWVLMWGTWHQRSSGLTSSIAEIVRTWRFHVVQVEFKRTWLASTHWCKHTRYSTSLDMIDMPKILGWNGIQLMISFDSQSVTCRHLIFVLGEFYVAILFDVLGWFSPTVIKMKVLLQRLWEVKLDWDDPVPDVVRALIPYWVGVSKEPTVLQLW